MNSREYTADRYAFDDPGVERRFLLEVGDGHSLNVEISGKGNFDVVACHGGPGGKIGTETRRFGDPESIRLIQFDQRGCGKSTPRGETRNNSLQHTLSDMEAIRTYLGSERWVVTGGSWGATVALAYAQAYPERTLGVIVRGAFLGEPAGFEWFDFAIRQVFPEVYDEFVEATGAAPNASVYDTVDRIYQTGDQAQIARAAVALTLYEEKAASFHPPVNLPEFDPQMCIDAIRIALHYRRNNAFLGERGVITGMRKMAHLPGVIIHGRYDIVCPAGNATKLKQQWAKAALKICDEAGHLASEPSIAQAMTHAFKNSQTWR